MSKGAPLQLHKNGSLRAFLFLQRNLQSKRGHFGPFARFKWPEKDLFSWQEYGLKWTWNGHQNALFSWTKWDLFHENEHKNARARGPPCKQENNALWEQFYFYSANYSQKRDKWTWMQLIVMDMKWTWNYF